MVLENLIETHSHILPAIDDGAKDVATSQKMIAKLSSQGAEAVIATPHYYSDSVSLSDFLSKRQKAYQALIRSLPPEAPRIIPAAEVYISEYLFHNDDLSQICIAGTRFAMIEHNFHSDFGQKTYNRLETLIYDYRITPVLVHIERYKALMDNPKLFDQYRELGCKTQVNISSFANAPRAIKKKLFKYIESDRIDFIGSDCHNMDSRPPQYAEGAEEIIKKCGRSALLKLIQNAQELINY